MKITKILLVAACFVINSDSMAETPLDILKSEGCDKILVTLAQTYLNDNADLLKSFEEQTQTGRALDVTSLELCKSIDLDPGSFDLNRETTFCNESGDSITLNTNGNLYCDGEKVLSIKSLTLKSACPSQKK